jgi:NADP-dependent 3-hydroxy acid dehydrogenase YdfG
MKIALAYLEEDAPLIKKLETDLSSSSYSFVHFDFSKSKPEYLLYEALDDYQWPILLFVSDKFLKSATSMTRMLNFFQKKEEQIYPILIPASTGEASTIPEIEKVGGIIKYINYWQEYYLDLRKQLKELHLADEDSFNDHLKRVREISTEIGEFLRLLRSSTYCSIAEFEANNYELFFEFLDDKDAWERFKDSSDEEEAPQVETAEEKVPEESFTEEALAEIPGISMIPEQEAEVVEIAVEHINLEEIPKETPAEEPVVEKIQTPKKKVVKAEPAVEKSEPIELSKDLEIEKAMAAKIEIKEEEIPSSDTQSALDALKDNINRLSQILKEKEEASKKAVEPRPGDGKTILITGGTSGIGKAMAEIFAKNGYDVIITGRRKDRMDELTKQLSETYDTTVKGLVFDVRNKKDVEKAMKSLGNDLKKVDILINNAGKAKGFDPIHSGNFDHWEEMIDTNVKGLLYMTRLVSPHMVANKSGHIINIGSIAGKEAYPNGNVYCATKFAVDGLTKAMRMDLHTHNVRVSQIAPAHVEETEFALVRFDGDAEKAKIYEDFTPVNARDIAETVYFMASRPNHVNILDVVIQGTQQPSAMILDRSGRK